MAIVSQTPSISEVKTVLAETSNSVGGLCTSPKINKWSKRKPFANNKVSLDGAKWWRRSNISDNIRCGFFIPNIVDGLWEYVRPSGGANSPYRLGDFRGYENKSSLNYWLNLPNQFILEEDYTMSFVFNGYNNGGIGEDVGSVGLQDVFDLENKYCCLKLNLNVNGNNNIFYSDRIMHSISPILGAEIIVPENEMNLITKRGIIYIDLSIIEADEKIGNDLINPKEFSLRADEEIITSYVNTQFKALGFIVYSNMDNSLTITRNNLIITSSGNEKVAVSSDFRTGGVFQDYWFRARALNNEQIGQDHLFALPTKNLGANQTEIIDIPQFTLQVGYPTETIVEFSVWEGNPGSVGSTMVLSHNYTTN